MPTTLKNDRLLLRELGHALEALHEATGVKGRVVAIEPQANKGYRPDALVDIDVNGKKHRYAVEAKTRVDRLEALGHIKAQLDQFGKHGLLFAPYITNAIAKQCRQLNIAFLDAAGNAYLHEPGLHVYITGEKPEGLATRTMGAQGAGTATALRIIFALLCRPELLNAPYRDIVEAADVALGAIGWVFFDLEKRGYIAGRQKKRNRRFLEPIRLFEEWVTNYPIKLRPKLNARRFRTENPEWWKDADIKGLKAYWGGEIAAQRLTSYLKPATCTLYVEPDLNQEKPTTDFAKFVAANRLRADAQGDIEILDAFWHPPADTNQTDVVPPILAYADLIAPLDPRNLEAAKRIRNVYINDAFLKP
jgi:hypothetical protein